MYFRRAQLNNHNALHWFFQNRQSRTDGTIKIFDPPFHSMSNTAHGLWRPTRTARKSVKNAWLQKKKKQAERQGLVWQVVDTHPFLGCCSRSQLKAHAARQKDRVILIGLKGHLKKLNQQTGLKTKQTQTTESNLQNHCTNVLYQQQTSPQCSNTRSTALCEAAPAPPSLWPGQALVPHTRQVPSSSASATQRTPHPKRGPEQIFQPLILWTKLIKKNREQL